MKMIYRGMTVLLVVLLLAHIMFVRQSLGGRHFAKYPRAAALYLTGSLEPERLADFSPLYLAAHVAARLLPSPEAWVTGAQVLMSVGSLMLLLLLLRRFFPPATTLAGGLLFVSSRSIAVYTCIFEPEATLLFLALGAVVLLVYKPRGSALAAGVLVGICLLLRPTLVPVMLLVPLFYCLAGRRAGRWAEEAAVFMAAPLAALLLLAAVNARAGGGFSPAVMNPGYVFFEGNNPLSFGQSAVYPPLVQELRMIFEEQPDRPHLSYRLAARRIEGRDISPREVNSFWAGKAAAFIRDYPKRFLRLVVLKGYHFFHSFRWHDVVEAQQLEEDLDRKGIPALPFGLIAALAVPGMVIFARRWREIWIAYAVIVSQATAVLLACVSERQRLVLVPLFILFAVAALDFMALSRRNKLLLLAIVVPLALPLLEETDRMRDERHRWAAWRLSDSMVTQAVRLRDGGLLREAARSAAVALASAPLAEDGTRPAYLAYPQGFASAALEWVGNPSPADNPMRLDRAILLLEAGKPLEADAILADLEAGGQRFNRLNRGSSEPAFYRGLAALRRGDRDGAATFLRQALERAPGDPFALAWLAALTGDADAGAKLRRYFGEADSRFLLGQANLDAGNAAEAVECLAYVAKTFPEYRRGRIYLAAALASAGRGREAVDAYLEIEKISPEPIMREEEILRAFRDTAESLRDNGPWTFRYGVILSQFGHFREALEIQESVRDPAVSQKAEGQIRWLKRALEGSGG